MGKRGWGDRYSNAEGEEPKLFLFLNTQSGRSLSTVILEKDRMNLRKMLRTMKTFHYVGNEHSVAQMGKILNG